MITTIYTRSGPVSTYGPQLDPAAYPPSLVTQPNWNRFNLTRDLAKNKFQKIPIRISTGEVANRDGIGIPFQAALASLCEDEVLSYRHPDASLERLALLEFDNCVSPDGTVSDAVQRTIRQVDGYTEISVSGTGVHILCWLLTDENLQPVHKHPPSGSEFYWSNNIIALTGNRVELPGWTSPTDIPERTEAYGQLHQEMFAHAYEPQTDTSTNKGPSCKLTVQEVLYLLFHERNGNKWEALFSGDWSAYATPSDADFALLMKLAFYSDKDRQMMTEIFSASPLSRILSRAQGTITKPKWQNQQYQNRTLDRVLAVVHVTYRPKNSRRRGGCL